MDWRRIIVLVILNTITIKARSGINLLEFMNIFLGSNYRKSSPILGVPRYPEDLPAAEPILPGHTLLRPTGNTLKSAAKYPLRDVGNALVYGNVDNLGISGAKGGRIKYTNFRKINDALDLFKQFLKKTSEGAIILPSKRKNKKYLMIVIQPQYVSNITGSDESFFHYTRQPEAKQPSEAENTANEILDNSPEVSEEGGVKPYRRALKGSHSKLRHRKRIYSSSTGSSESSGSSDYEKNPGNPYTLHKNKYKQNWMWNHIMDGDHMNVNPYAPGTPEMGPSGNDLFFSRKWWYFNQDDYKPLAR